MRLLDKNLSALCVPRWKNADDAVHVDNLGLAEAADDVILLVEAREDDCVVVSSDTDFGGLLAAERVDGRLPSR